MLRGMSKPQQLLKSFQDVLSVFRVLVYYFWYYKHEVIIHVLTRRIKIVMGEVQNTN